MTIRSALIIGIAASLAAAPVAAQTDVRTAAPVADAEQIAANPWIPWLVALVAAAIIIVVITDDEEATSP